MKTLIGGGGGGGGGYEDSVIRGTTYRSSSLIVYLCIFWHVPIQSAHFEYVYLKR